MKTKTIKTMTSKFGTKYRIREFDKKILVEFMVPRVSQMTKAWMTMQSFSSLIEAEKFLKEYDSITKTGIK